MNPPEIIPPFLAKELEVLDDPTLLAAALHAESDGIPADRAPETVSMAFTIQDDAMVSAIDEYTRTLAESDQTALLNRGAASG